MAKEVSQYEIASRVRHIMEVKGINQRRLAELLGLDPSNLSKVLNGHLPFSRGLVNRLVADLGVSKRWLVEGVGVPFEKPGEAMVVEVVEVPEPRRDVDGLPVFDIDATAGCRTLSTVFAEQKPMGGLNLPNIPAGTVFINVQGDSMAPKILNGALVGINPDAHDRNILWGQIYVVELEGRRMVKYLRRHPDSAYVILRSENPDYDDIDVLRSDITALYLVKAIINVIVNP